MTYSRRALILAASLVSLLPSAPAWAQPCCGPITPAGEQLARFLDGTGVDHLWQPGEAVDWETGGPSAHEVGSVPTHSHCSAFVAAIAERLGVYILRPPQHTQLLLANAQMRWLSQSGSQSGWRSVPDERTAQTLANQGIFVVASWENPDSGRPGHIAIVRPSLKTADELARQGPQTTQAGSRNHISSTVEIGFRERRSQVLFFAHDLR
jgi:hypothetical protein